MRVKDVLRYDKMVDAALRGVVREVLARAAASGLPGTHHFYITFRTAAPGVAIPDHLRQQYPEEMTIVLENQFWDLEVEESNSAVTLELPATSPSGSTVPFAAITAFADPAVKFGLQFQVEGQDAAGGAADGGRSRARPPPRRARSSPSTPSARNSALPSPRSG